MNDVTAPNAATTATIARIVVAGILVQCEVFSLVNVLKSESMFVSKLMYHDL
jgi:hypothetical protein